MGKSTIYMVIFNSYVSLPKGIVYTTNGLSWPFLGQQPIEKNDERNTARYDIFDSRPL
jgi:hypothetical protein